MPKHAVSRETFRVEHMGKVGEWQGKSHGKIILIGEHSVVYHQPAIAMPLHEAALTAAVRTRDDAEVFLDCEYYTGHLSGASENLRNVIELVVRLRRDFSLEKQGFDIRITSSIPHERGMGSSAAVAVAIVRAMAQMAGRSLSSQEEFEYVQIAENIAHTNASGMDAYTVASREAVWFERGKRATKLKFDTPAVLVVADTGIKGSTRKAVGDVCALMESPNKQVSRETSAYIEYLGQLTRACADALTDGDIDALGSFMDSAQETLEKLTVSSVELDHLIETARTAGALGAKLTGGGRGGCMIALAKDAKAAHVISEALCASGAVKTWYLPLVSRQSQEFPQFLEK